MGGMESFFVLLGRLAIGLFFLWKAAERIQHWGEASEALRKKHVPYASLVLPISMIVQVVGGLAIIFGFYTQAAAVLLLIYMAAHMYKLHAFWQMARSSERMLEKLLFMKDFAIIGALLLLIGIGGGSWSVHS